MRNNQLKWCLRLKDGLKIVEPSERLTKTYLNEAKLSLERAEKNFIDGDLLWTTVVIYYAEYYALYSFLQRIGIKCENHFCSILAVSILLGEDKTHIINQHKEKRIDALYYMRIGRKDEVEKMIQEAKIFVSTLDNIISNLTDYDIKLYRERINLKKPEKSPS